VQDAPFKIYSASAGSGKTYTLTKAYLKIILTKPKGYRKILAITFTNKAVNEMKHRILDSLFNFGRPEIPKESKAMYEEICIELQIEPLVLKQRSRSILKEILHNYSFFDISTIDKFTHRLIRTFAHDLRLSLNFEVVLDVDLLVDEAVSRLIEKAGSNEQLTKVLIDFSLEKIEDNKSWDVAYDLNQIGKLLFNENHVPHLKKLENKKLDDFLALKKLINKKISFMEHDMVSLANKALTLIKDHGLEFSDFSASYFPKFMVKIHNKDFKIDFNAGWKRNFDTLPLYNKSCAQETKTILDALHSEFITLFNKLKDDHNSRSFLINVHGNIIPLAVLNEIQQEVKNILEERNQLSISDFNSIVSKEIKGQPAPFIYERLGEKYRHYFIDEFQDTSVMQWTNLVPLVGNAIEGQDGDGDLGSLFLVGDGKQAIYRWRGGKAEQFLDIVNEKTNPFVISPQIENLPKNYRSFKEIVDFNNDFFSTASTFLQNETYMRLFEEDHKQDATGTAGGIVQIDFIVPEDETSKDELYCQNVLHTIQTVQQNNYELKDITILVRDNKHGVVLAEFLTANKVDIISADSLLIASSAKVRFLIDLLRYSIDTDDLQTGYSILSFLAEKTENKHEFIHGNLFAIEALFKKGFEFDLRRLKKIAVYDGLEYAIRQFRLAEDSDAYLTQLMDTVFEVAQKKGTGAPAFLSYWEEKKSKICITAPETINAVQIMSIHKAKGLEFNVVIYPFANSRIRHRSNDKKMWIPVIAEEYHDFEELLINEKKEVVEYGQLSKEIYSREEHQMELDAFNVLYVALTRAIRALYIISEKDLTSKGAHKTEYYSGLFIHYLKERGLWQDDKTSYSFGKLTVFDGPETESLLEKIPYQYSSKERAGFRVLATSGMLWDTEVQNARIRGNLLHHVMGLIENRNDMEKAIATLQQNGDISSEQIDYIEAKVNQILEHPVLAKYYGEGFEVRNEADILTKKGQLVRPDRIVINGKKATLIDYKTGKRNPSYHEQLYTYSDTLSSMGYEVDNKIIVYIDESITPEFI